MERIEALEDAIQKKSLVGIYSVFYTIAHGDPNFSTGKFMEALAYVKSKNIEGLMQEFDGDDFEDEEKWDEEYWAFIASTLIDNFCMTRINHLMQVGRKVYPMKTQVNALRSNKEEQSAHHSIENKSIIQQKGHSILSEERKQEVKQKHQQRINEKNKISPNDIFAFFRWGRR